MAGTPFVDQGAIAVTSEDLYTPPANTYALVRHIHVANTNAASRSVSLWRGATGAEGAGTAITEGEVITGNTTKDYYFPAGLKFTTTDFLVGLSTVDGTSLEATVTGELYAA